MYYNVKEKSCNLLSDLHAMGTLIDVFEVFGLFSFETKNRCIEFYLEFPKTKNISENCVN